MSDTFDDSQNTVKNLKYKIAGDIFRTSDITIGSNTFVFLDLSQNNEYHLY